MIFIQTKIRTYFSHLAIMIQNHTVFILVHAHLLIDAHPPFLEPRNNDCARYFTYYRP